MSNQLAVSHIAWSPDAEDEMLRFMLSHGVKSMELAPMRSFGTPSGVTQRDVQDKVQRYVDRGISICSFQALLFGSEGLSLFESDEARLRLKQWLIDVGRVAGWCGAGPMVFGSPKNRLKGALSHAQAMDIAVPFFREVGDACAESGSCLVMEANPEAYGADFCTSLAQAAELVEAVGSPGFRLHVDAGGLALSGENFAPVIHQASHLIAHVHASQPHLADWNDPHPVHETLARELHAAHYQESVAIEMRMQEDVTGSVKTAVEKVREIYFAS